MTAKKITKAPQRVKPCFRYAHPDKGDGALHWVPDDFPSFLDDKHRTLVDQLIMRLINARNDLDDPARGLEARALIDRIVQTMGDFDPPFDTRSARADRERARHERGDGQCACLWGIGRSRPQPFCESRNSRVLGGGGHPKGAALGERTAGRHLPSGRVVARYEATGSTDPRRP